MENSIITWYSRKKQRNLTFRFYMHFIKNCALILAWISRYFEQILHIFRASIFVCISGYVFLTFGTKMAPKRLPKSTQNLKKNQNSALQFNWYVPDSVLIPFWMHFGRHLGGFRNLLVAICCRCWQFWVAPWASSGHHRFARCQLWSDTLNFPSCD